MVLTVWDYEKSAGITNNSIELRINWQDYEKIWSHFV